MKPPFRLRDRRLSNTCAPRYMAGRLIQIQLNVIKKARADGAPNVNIHNTLHNVHTVTRLTRLSDCCNFLAAFSCVSVFLATTSFRLSTARPAWSHVQQRPTSPLPSLSPCECMSLSPLLLGSSSLSRMHLPSKRRLHVTVHCCDFLPTFRCPSLFLPVAPRTCSLAHAPQPPCPTFSPSRMFSASNRTSASPNGRANVCLCFLTNATFALRHFGALASDLSFAPRACPTTTPITAPVFCATPAFAHPRPTAMPMSACCPLLLTTNDLRLECRLASWLRCCWASPCHVLSPAHCGAPPLRACHPVSKSGLPMRAPLLPPLPALA